MVASLVACLDTGSVLRMNGRVKELLWWYTVNFDQSGPTVSLSRRIGEKCKGKLLLTLAMFITFLNSIILDMVAAFHPQMFISKFQGCFFLPTAHLKFGSRWWGRSSLVSWNSKMAYCFILLIRKFSEVLHFTFEVFISASSSRLQVVVQYEKKFAPVLCFMCW